MKHRGGEIFQFIMLNHHQPCTVNMRREPRYLRRSHKVWKPFLKYCMKQCPNYLYLFLVLRDEVVRWLTVIPWVLAFLIGPNVKLSDVEFGWVEDETWMSPPAVSMKSLASRISTCWRVKRLVLLNIEAKLLAPLWTVTLVINVEWPVAASKKAKLSGLLSDQRVESGDPTMEPKDIHTKTESWLPGTG